MNNLLVKIYNKIPVSFRYKIGRIELLKKVRDLILKKKGIYKEATVEIIRRYIDYDINFKFIASIKTAAKALNTGIENTVLRNSIQLLNDKNNNINDCVVFDIGANFGYLSLVWAKSISKFGNVFSFEPNINVYNSFCKSILANGLSKIIIPVYSAVGCENKNIKIFLNNTHSNIINTENSKEYNNVKMITIDSYFIENNLNKCDLVKIDVDGIELDILKGSIETLKKFRPVFVVETNNDIQIINFFKQNDYKILNMQLEEYSKSSHFPLNIFCIPN